MAKKEIVDGLIGNEQTTFNEEDRDALLELNEDLLQKMEPVANQDSEDTDESAEEEAAEEVVEADAEGADGDDVVENSPLSAEDYVANAPPEIRDMLTAGLAAHQRDRQKLIDVVVANDANIFSNEELIIKSMSELKGLAALAVTKEVPAANAGPSPSYAGAAAPSPVRNSNDDEEAPLLIPVLNWDADGGTVNSNFDRRN